MNSKFLMGGILWFRNYNSLKLLKNKECLKREFSKFFLLLYFSNIIIPFYASLTTCIPMQEQELNNLEIYYISIACVLRAS